MIYVYITECSDRSFYTGITSNPKRREFEHNNRIKSSLQLSKLPVKIVYLEKFHDRISAARREKEIKGWGRTKKAKLISLRRMEYDEFTLRSESDEMRA